MKKHLLKSPVLMSSWLIGLAISIALAIPIPVAAQHHHYKIIDTGTLLSKAQ